MVLLFTDFLLMESIFDFGFLQTKKRQRKKPLIMTKFVIDNWRKNWSKTKKIKKTDKKILKRR